MLEMDAMDVDGHAHPLPGNEFHLFPNLPTELRFKIWSYNLPGPRVVKIWYQKSPDQKSPPRLVSCSPVPANLHTNRESRAEALRTHPLHFGFHGRTGQIPFNPQHDVLFFVPAPPHPGLYPSDLFADIKISLLFIPDPELARIQRLAIDAAPTLLPHGRPPPAVQMVQDPHQLCQTRRTLEVLEDIRRYLPRLREFHLVTPPENIVDPDGLDPDDVLCHATGLKVSMEEWTKRAIAILAEETEGWDTPVCSVDSIDCLLSPATAPVPNFRCFDMVVPKTLPAFDLVRNSLRDLLRQIRPARLQCTSGASGSRVRDRSFDHE